MHATRNTKWNPPTTHRQQMEGNQTHLFHIILEGLKLCFFFDY